MKVFFIDAETNVSKLIDIDLTLENYYKILKCRLIDITERKINGKYFDIIVDDEGLFDSSNRVSAVYEDGSPALVGSLIICNHDGEGNETALSPGDICKIQDKLAIATSPDGVKYNVVVLDNED